MLPWISLVVQLSQQVFRVMTNLHKAGGQALGINNEQKIWLACAGVIPYLKNDLKRGRLHPTSGAPLLKYKHPVTSQKVEDYPINAVSAEAVTITALRPYCRYAEDHWPEFEALAYVQQA